MTVEEVHRHLKELADPAIARHSRRFFKTGRGEYGEGDMFLGIRVPVLRGLVRQYRAMSLDEIQKLLGSPFHEERLLALLLLVKKYESGDEDERHEVYRLYFDNLRFVNNWDLVDSSAPYIVGHWLLEKDKKPLYVLAGSDRLWERRVAILSTFYFIRKERFDDTLAISLLLIHDSEDLIHKAVGWMLREVGKRDTGRLRDFLKKHYNEMPRTMLRYAIERLPENERKRYLKGLE